MSTLELNAAFAGLFEVTKPNLNSQLDKEEIDDDISGEQETVIPQMSNKTESTFPPGQLEEAILQASKGVGESTDGAYKSCVFNTLRIFFQSVTYFSLMIKCEKFLIDRGLIELNGNFFTATPIDNAPMLIVAWIMDAYIFSLNQTVNKILIYL